MLKIQDGSVGSESFMVYIDPGTHDVDVLWVYDSRNPPPDQLQTNIGISDLDNDLPDSTVSAWLFEVAMIVGRAFPTSVAGQTYALPAGGMVRLSVQDTSINNNRQVRYDVNLIGASDEDAQKLIEVRNEAQAALAAAFPIEPPGA